MPTITLNRKEFDKLMGKKIPDSLLKDRISMLGTDLDKLDKDEIVVEVFPNRPDMLSMQGFVRALKDFMGITKGFKNFKVEKSGEKVIVDKSLPKEWPYVFACIVKGLKFNDEKIKEIIDIQEKLGDNLLRKRKKGGIGLYPLEKITFPVKFEGRKPEDIKFKPLEFEGEVNGRQILSKHPTGREYGKIISGWKKYPVFVDDKGIIMSMPPIINSDDVGKIKEETTDVFLEATGTDYNILKSTINMIVTALADMGGKIYSVDVVYNGKKVSVPDLKPVEMDFDLDYCNKWLGLDLKANDVKKLLEKMGYGFGKKVLVPAYRADIMHQVDFFEDVAIAYGIENFVEEIPKVATIGKESEMSVFRKKIAEILCGCGLLELNTYHISNKIDQNDKMGLDNGLIELESSVSSDRTHLRYSMIPNLLEVFNNNKHNEYPQKIFDMGVVFKKGKSETGVVESVNLGVGLCDSKVDYTNCKQILDYLMRMIDIEYSIEEVEHPSFIKGRVGKIIVNKKEVGFIGEINPYVLSNFKMEMPVVAFELNLSSIFEEF